MGPSQPPIQWVPGALFQGVKRLWREACLSLPSSVPIASSRRDAFLSSDLQTIQGVALYVAESQVGLREPRRVSGGGDGTAAYIRLLDVTVLSMLLTKFQFRWTHHTFYLRNGVVNAAMFWTSERGNVMRIEKFS
jgi:hypothetical protein